MERPLRTFSPSLTSLRKPNALKKKSKTLPPLARSPPEEPLTWKLSDRESLLKRRSSLRRRWTILSLASSPTCPDT